MFERARYILGVTLAIGMPIGLLYWFVIHLWARSWRVLGPIRTYLIVLPALALLGVWVFGLRGRLLGANLGNPNWGLIGAALVLLYVSTRLELRIWRHVSIATLAGIPELSRHSEGKLLRDGAYRMVRHPRYLSAGLGVIAEVLIVNYRGLDILMVVVFAAGGFMLALEERELVDRFGEAYREYQREVPQLIPRFRRERR